MVNMMFSVADCPLMIVGMLSISAAVVESHSVWSSEQSACSLENSSLRKSEPLFELFTSPIGIELFESQITKVGVGVRACVGVGACVGVQPPTAVQEASSAIPPTKVQAWQLLVQYCVAFVMVTAVPEDAVYKQLWSGAVAEGTVSTGKDFVPQIHALWLIP